MTRHLWVLVVLPWDGFLVSFSVGLFPSGVGCRRLYCGSRIFCRSDWDSGITLLNWYRFFGNLMCQLLLRSISFTDSWGESLWLRRPFGCCQPLLLGQHLGFRRRPILYKLSSVWFAVGRLVSLQWLELSQTCLRWDRSRSIRFSSEVNLLFFRVGDGSLLSSIQTFSEVGFFTERSRCWRVSFRTCLWYRRWLNRSITSGFCPHCLYESKGSDSLFECWIVSRFSIGGYRLQRYAH